MTYKQLTLKERYHIWALLKKGYNQKEIAKSIGVHPIPQPSKKKLGYIFKSV